MGNNEHERQWPCHHRAMEVSVCERKTECTPGHAYKTRSNTRTFLHISLLYCAPCSAQYATIGYVFLRILEAWSSLRLEESRFLQCIQTLLRCIHVYVCMWMYVHCIEISMHMFRAYTWCAARFCEPTRSRIRNYAQKKKTPM